jgi:hypothetical protein
MHLEEKKGMVQHTCALLADPPPLPPFPRTILCKEQIKKLEKK